MIETRRSRQDRRSGRASRSHVVDLNQRQRGFAGNKDQRPAFFQMHVGSSLDQITTRRGGDSRQRTAATRTNDHATSQMRTAGDWRHEILIVVIDKIGRLGRRKTGNQLLHGKILQVDFKTEFVLGYYPRRIADRQMDFGTRLQQDFKQALPIDHAAGSGDRNNNWKLAHLVPR